jgi:hypothetical protein
MKHSTSDHPFAIWRVFHDAPRWWFARGCPPTLRNLSGWVRALHVSVLLGVTGLAAAGLGAVVLVGGGVRPPWDGVSFGVIYSAIVLVPLSRWVGRAWWWTLLSVPFLAVWYGPVLDMVQHSHLQSNMPVELNWLVTSAILGLGPGLWMCSRRNPRSWSMLPAILLACTLSTVAAALSRHHSIVSWNLPFAIPHVVHMLIDVQPVVLFFSLTAAAFGIRLWEGVDNQRDELRPAANTEATSTANPSSSTDVAVSPGLNSP